jgi:hypothetical protein
MQQATAARACGLGECDVSETIFQGMISSVTSRSTIHGGTLQRYNVHPGWHFLTLMFHTWWHSKR